MDVSEIYNSLEGDIAGHLGLSETTYIEYKFTTSIQLTISILNLLIDSSRALLNGPLF